MINESKRALSMVRDVATAQSSLYALHVRRYVEVEIDGESGSTPTRETKQQWRVERRYVRNSDATPTSCCFRDSYGTGSL